jgi:DNA-binding MarR family transcriptional regulator
MRQFPARARNFRQWTNGAAGIPDSSAESREIRQQRRPAVVMAEISGSRGASVSPVLDNQADMSVRRHQIGRLAPLIPQLAFAWRRRSGEIPAAFKNPGGFGERHVSMLISLAIEGPGNVSELANRLQMTTAHASLVVGELARAGLVGREHDERDRRLIVVSLSDAAKPAVAEMRKRHAAPLLKFLDELDEEEADRFIDHLSRLVAHIRPG